jgi:hypothetical protein
MLAIVMPDGPVRRAIERDAAARGEAFRSFEDDLTELFETAMKSRAIVSIAAGSEVLGAMNAPGSRRLVLVRPAGEPPEALLTVRRSGVPWVVVQRPALLEAIAEKLGGSGVRRWWLPRDARRRVVTAEAVAAAVTRALDSPDDGVVEELPGEELSSGELVRRALGARRVHVLPRSLFEAGRRLGLLAEPDIDIAA